ncbi:MAG TPA: PIN domain-containing protein [Spirochaetota bacterium]|nr:PIN domain-containing protein [Spirochaetota bacterium]HOM10454.1 PIN domain-containing protein [Spirochaetota bacterium]HPP50201.1 PIN domain-containing protein [Spirochaetota bacterium]
MIYMLDTNVCSYIIREKPYHLKDKIVKVYKEHTVSLSSIVVAELLYGAKKKNSKALTQIIELFIENFVIFDFDRKAAVEYASIRDSLEKSGNIIGSNDLFIAAHAKSLNAVLVTNNAKEFKRIKGLKVENWM